MTDDAKRPDAERPDTPAAPDMPPEVFEILVSAWVAILEAELRACGLLETDGEPEKGGG